MHHVTPGGLRTALHKSAGVEDRRTVWLNLVFLVFVILYCLIPSFVLARRRVTFPYFNTIVSQVMAASAGGKLIPVEQASGVVISDPYQQGHIGYQSIVLAISKVCGISPELVQFVPLGGLIIAFLSFVLMKSLLDSNILATLFAVYFSFDPTLVKGHFNIHAYAWSRALFLVFFFLCIKILTKRTTGAVALLIIIYIGTFLIYWTTPVWMLVLWSSVAAIPIIQRIFSSSSDDSERQSITMVIIFVVIYLAFSKVLYQYIPQVADAVYGGPEDGWALFRWQILRIFAKTEETGPYAYVGATTTNPLLGWFLLFRYIILIIPHILYLGVYMKGVVTKQHTLLPGSSNTADLLIWGGLLSIALHTGGYLLRGHVSFRPALIILPITGILCIRRMKLSPKINFVFLLPLALLSIGGYFLHYQELPTFDVKHSAQWLFEQGGDTRVLTDLNTSQKYLLEQVDQGIWLKMQHYTPDDYGYIVDDEPAQSGQAGIGWSYVVIDQGLIDQPVVSGGWNLFEPFSFYLDDIYANTELNLVYDDGRYLIFQRR
jgi:hypothetical protein